ncbi:DUF2235 domain-containing protein [Alteromonas sp. KUL106]|uniref:DUF2235 domain-containing protein n=1 Tax=Alteromonas sp. KUL106 TaxID=2480799 RepID=UPI0012E6951E|nr:DUF2235 domain-containing protein [Alteromonas sp. KUL106]GFD70372.1 hypothetical protein KUL106_36350 [Alteromonas sp. KUL106]
MNKKRMILCLDGTWNNTYTESKRDSGDNVLKPTNVLKIARAIKPYDLTNDITQIVYYDSGVGSSTTYPGPANWMLKTFDKYLGGGWGAGFESNIEEAITFLVHNYVPGQNEKESDEVYVFGFSRGAATACALCNFISWLGGLPNKNDAYYIPILFRTYIKTKGKKAAVDVINSINNPTNDNKPNKDRIGNLNQVSIKMLGVWDTVVALGSKMLNIGRKRYFVSEEAPTCVKNVYHAIAIDERRADFKPEIWTNYNHSQRLTQRWFAGVHSNVGGGYVKDGLANCSLKFMVEAAEKLGIEFDHTYLKYYRCYPQDRLYRSKSIFYRVLDLVRFKLGLRPISGRPTSCNQDIAISALKLMFTDSSKVGQNGKPVHNELKNDYRPKNVIDFLNSLEDPLEYCKSIWLEQGSHILSGQELAQIDQLLNDILNK